MTIGEARGGDSYMRALATGRAVELPAGAAEPEVGTTLRKGAPPGKGDSIRFDHVSDGPDGWVETVNDSTHGHRVSWEEVRWWLPMTMTR